MTLSQWIASGGGIGHVPVAPGTIASLAALAFALFRLLDIFKPGPIGWVDRKDGAIAVMADDVVAGLIAAAVLFVVGTLFPRF